MTRAKTPQLTYPAAQARPACGNGHTWRPETTRWRKRIRNGRTTTERDCLVCKRESEHTRRRNRRAQLTSAPQVATRAVPR